MQSKLYVGNLSFSTTEDSLRATFSPFGEVARVTIVTDRDTGRSRGFGFVEMATDAAAQSAIEGLDGSTVDGRAIQVNVARPKEDRPRFGGGGGGGGFGGGGGGGGFGGGGGRGGPRGGDRGGRGGGGGGRDRW